MASVIRRLHKFRIAVFAVKSGNSPEIVHTCRLTYVEAMLHFSPSYAYLHQSKMAAVGHLGLLTFDRIASYNSSFLTNLNTLITLKWLFLRLNVI